LKVYPDHFLTFVIISGMSLHIAVKSTVLEADNNGCFLRVQSKEDLPRAWSKWYPSPEIASIDGERLGLTERQEFLSGLTMTVRRHFKQEAVIDPDDLIRFNFAPVVDLA
jgi:hypothetical protein